MPVTVALEKGCVVKTIFPLIWSGVAVWSSRTHFLYILSLTSCSFPGDHLWSLCCVAFFWNRRCRIQISSTQVCLWENVPWTLYKDRMVKYVTLYKKNMSCTDMKENKSWKLSAVFPCQMTDSVFRCSALLVFDQVKLLSCFFFNIIFCWAADLIPSHFDCTNHFCLYGTGAPFFVLLRK